MHLWVEDFLELFSTVMVAYIFVLPGVVRKQIAIRVIYLDILLYSVGGVIGTIHHLYFSGAPAQNLALGAFFSAAEVIPLTFLTVKAWTFLQLGSRQESRSALPFPHRWAVMFLVAVGFWNFLGAGVFGFLINLPIVSYYEIGTSLTLNHAHTAMMGVYGMLACGLADEHRLARYRANRHACNRCAVKARCADSDEGREITRPLDPWPHSEAGRFHRGIALVPVCLALVILPIEALRHATLPDLGVLIAPAVVAGAAALRLIADFRASPANFPEAGASPSAPTPPLAATRWGETTWRLTPRAAPRPDTRTPTQTEVSSVTELSWGCDVDHAPQ